MYPRLRAAIDSNSVGFFEIDVGAAYDFTDWFGIQAGVRMLRSSAIDLTSSNALLTIRWPQARAWTATQRTVAAGGSRWRAPSDWAVLP